MRALPPYREPFAVAEPAIRSKIHQSLDVHRDLSPQIPFNGVISIDQLADTQHVVVGQLVDPPLGRYADFAADLEGLGSANPVDIGEPDRDPLLVGNIDSRDARQLRSPRNYKMGVGSAPRKGEDYTDRT